VLLPAAVAAVAIAAVVVQLSPYGLILPGASLPQKQLSPAAAHQRYMSQAAQLLTCCPPHDLLHVSMVHSSAQALPAHHRACRQAHGTVQGSSTHGEQRLSCKQRGLAGSTAAQKFAACKHLHVMLLQHTYVAATPVVSAAAKHMHCLHADPSHSQRCGTAAHCAQCAHLCLCTLGTHSALQVPNLP
jgi:hypothetical protein